MKKLFRGFHTSRLWPLVLSLVLLIVGAAGFAGFSADRKVLGGSIMNKVKIANLLSRPNAIPLKVGTYIQDFHDLSLENQHFSAEGYYWLEWNEELNSRLQQEQIEPTSIVELTNQIERWNSKLFSFADKPKRLPNGNYYQQVQFSSYFSIPDLNLRRFPFETIQLPILIELGDDSLALENADVVLVPDVSSNALVGSSRDINGYKIVASDLEPVTHSYGTNWGLSEGDLTYSGVVFSATLKSTILPGILKYVLPFAIVVGIVVLAPSLEGELGDIRLAIPSTGLLTLVFLQQSYRLDLPDLDYLSFLDWIYACGYLISIATFLLFVWGTNVYQRASNENKNRVLLRINRIDSVFQVSALLGTLLVGCLAWYAT